MGRNPLVLRYTIQASTSFNADWWGGGVQCTVSTMQEIFSRCSTLTLLDRFITVLCKDYRGIYRSLSYMNKGQGSELNRCCQVFGNFSASVTKFIHHIFCINFVIINFVTYKLSYIFNLFRLKFLTYKLCYLSREKLAAETCQDLAALYPTGMSVLYSAQCNRTSVFHVHIFLESFVFLFCLLIYIHLYNLWYSLQVLLPRAGHNRRWIDGLIPILPINTIGFILISVIDPSVKGSLFLINNIDKRSLQPSLTDGHRSIGTHSVNRVDPSFSL